VTSRAEIESEIDARLREIKLKQRELEIMQREIEELKTLSQSL